MSTQIDEIRGTSPASRTIYLVALAATFVVGLVIPGFGLALALVLGVTVLKHRRGDANRLHLMGFLTLALWLVALLTAWLMDVI